MSVWGAVSVYQTWIEPPGTADIIAMTHASHVYISNCRLVIRFGVTNKSVAACAVRMEGWESIQTSQWKTEKTTHILCWFGNYSWYVLVCIVMSILHFS